MNNPIDLFSEEFAEYTRCIHKLQRRRLVLSGQIQHTLPNPTYTKYMLADILRSIRLFEEFKTKLYVTRSRYLRNKRKEEKLNEKKIYTIQNKTS